MIFRSHKYNTSTLNPSCLSRGSPRGAEAVAYFQTVVKLFQVSRLNSAPSSCMTHWYVERHYPRLLGFRTKALPRRWQKLTLFLLLLLLSRMNLEYVIIENICQKTFLNDFMLRVTRQNLTALATFWTRLVGTSICRVLLLKVPSYCLMERTKDPAHQVVSTTVLNLDPAPLRAL